MNSAGSGLVGLLNGVVEEQVSIYALWEDGVIVYVGSSSDPSKRLASHRAGGFLGRDIQMEVMAWVAESDRGRVEKFAIRAGLRWGYPLENIIWRY